MAGTSDALPKSYDPTEVETRWYAVWNEAGVFHADARDTLEGGKRPYVIMMPPPNVPGTLHNGHALFVTLQDLLDATFGYVAGSIKVDQSLDSAVVCPGGSCDESAILAQVDSMPAVCGTTGNECTDAPDVDPVSFSGTTVHAGDGNEPGNAQLDVPAGKVLALLFQVLIQ